MTNAPTMKRKRDGSLRDALIDAGIEVLRDRGAEGMSLRECAAKAGVSHAAPAYHFKNLKGLTTAIATRAFVLFSKFMDDDRQRAAPDPASQLAAICAGYYKFATGHRELFLFMFSGQAFDSEDEAFKIAADRSYAILRECCAPFVHPGMRPKDVEILIWSLVHGYSHLAMTRQDKGSDMAADWPDLRALLAQIRLSAPDREPS